MTAPHETGDEHAPTTVAPDGDTIREWLVTQVAARTGVPTSEVDVDQFLDEFQLDSTEALVLAGELENWLGVEVSPTALWYHPTIARLARHLAASGIGNDAGT
ncbi:acyl carrier protein [Actinoalloteichus caeruleus]|uniref:acyl carrier protein n=1 Tax=Actinoalloteichus cyanogriseus TaxID=2893586 RepID=UPI0009DF4F2F|nr:acyl carrier protein [Actinoalloteichus caeruleus]